MASFLGRDPESIRRRLAELAVAAEEERQDRRAFVRTIVLLVFWPVVALLGMAWGFQMDDSTIGPAVSYLFVAIGDLGILGTLVGMYFRNT